MWSLTMNGLKVILCVLLIGTAGTGSSGQSTGETALAKLRGDFEVATAHALLAPLKARTQQLATLEKQAAAAWDWETALAAREARQRAELELAAAEKLTLIAGTVSDLNSSQGIVSLPLAAAKLEGVRLDPASRVLTDWAGPGSKATWTLPDLPPGGYEVVLKYESTATQGGSLRAQEQFYTLNADTRITLNGAAEHNLGTLRIRTGNGPFVLSALKVSKGGLMKLASVELHPVSD